MDVEALAKRLLGLIESRNIDEGEVYVESSAGLEISLRDQEIERLRNKDLGGFALRVISGNRMGFVHSSDLRAESLERAVDQGVALAKAAAADEFNSLVEPSPAGTPPETYDQSVEEIPFERRVNLLKDIETLCFAYDPAISKMEYLGYSDARTETVIANTKGVFRRGRSTRFSVSVSVLAERDGEVETGGEEIESRFFEQLESPSKVASRACWKAVSLLGAEDLATRTAPVVFDRDVGYALLRHVFAMVSGNNVADGLSVLEDRLGQQIASGLVTMVDDATIDGAIGSRGFDAEGTASRRTVIINQGILESFLFDGRSGRKSGMANTGNASRRGFRELPAVGITNLFVEKGEVSPEDIMKSMSSGLWLISLAGWWVGINPSTGDFSSGAKGLWIEDGSVAYPVKNVTIASNVLDMLASVDAVGDDLYMRHETASPTMRISSMQIGGV